MQLAYRCPLGKVEVERVDPLEDLLRLVHALPPRLRQVAEPVPLVADVLAPRVDDGAVPVVQRVQLLRDGGDLLHAVLVRRQVALERLVLLLHRLQLEDLAVLVVLK